MNRTVKVVLAISIVLNVLLGGMQLGYVSHCLVTSPGGAGVETQLAKLPPEKRVLFNTIMGPATQQMDQNHSHIDDAKKEALRILTTEPFDSKAYLAQVQHINDLHQQMKQQMADVVVTVAKQFTQDERRILAEIISHPPFTLPPGALHHEGPAPADR